MEVRFRKRAAVVTGAAGGIGWATALRLAHEGARVLAVDVQAEPLADLAAISIGGDGEIRALVCDVAADEAPAKIVAHCEADFGRLDMLINNAGIGGAHSVAQTDDAEFDRFITVNLRAVFRLSREALKLLPRPGGRIVNVSSVFGLVGYPGSSSYAVAKAGVAQLTRQMAADYAPQGLLINAVAPGVIRTPMTEARIEGDAWYRRIMIDTTPVPRIGTPEDVAGTIAFLCSDDARFIAGEVIRVDGGWTATRYLPPDERDAHGE
jgi:meso-butanediol dehydrogenase / (S,S)-butanediol dehydrogenase / diacetyl reductase